MNDQLTAALLTEIQSLNKAVSELTQIVKGNQLLEKQPDPTVEFLKPDPDKLPITAGLEGRISALLQELKVPVNINGYVYLREAIKMSVQDFGCVVGIMKSIYPDIATKYDSTVSRVERAIRFAIETSYKKNKKHPFYSEFKYDGKPTNSTFIALIADRFILEEAELEAVSR